MNTATQSIEQKARITGINGNVQLIRDGFFLPAQIGMELLPGDRVVSDNGAKAVIQFTGLNDSLVIEKGAAATFNLEVVELDKAPQWIATDLYGEGIYFDSAASAKPAVANTAGPDLFGLFGTEGNSESTGYPVLESLVFLGATAAIYSDNEDNPDSTETAASGSDTEGSNNPPTDNQPPTTVPQPPADPQPEPNPLGGILQPVSGILDGLLGSTGTASPLGSLSNPSQTDVLLNSLSSTESIR